MLSVSDSGLRFFKEITHTYIYICIYIYMYREKGCVRIDMGAWGLRLELDSFSKKESLCGPFSGSWVFATKDLGLP